MIIKEGQKKKTGEKEKAGGFTPPAVLGVCGGLGVDADIARAGVVVNTGQHAPGLVADGYHFAARIASAVCS